MNRNSINKYLVIACFVLTCGACNVPALTERAANKITPANYINSTTDTVNSARVEWKKIFTDPYLAGLIDTALKNNQELNITLREIEISRNEIKARKGEYLPFVGLRAGAGLDKAARYTNTGALEENIEIDPGHERPEPLPDYQVTAFATWEVDVWHK
ncbi:MAG: TolC family protein, partial [Sphingobacteriales bacterium]